MTKNKKLIDKKIQSIQTEENENDNFELVKSDEEEAEVNNLQENKSKQQIEAHRLKNKEDKYKSNNKDISSKKSKEKKLKEIKSAYDYELEVLNNNGIENDDFFIVE